MIVNADIPFEIIIGSGVFVMVLIGATVYFGTYWMDIRSKHPELHVLQKARKPPFPPAVGMVDPSGRTIWFNGEKEKASEIKLKNNDYGLLFDPYMVSRMPKTRFADGTGYFMYGAGFHFPTDANGARTIIQFVRNIRNEYPKLNFIRDDIVLMELFTKSGTDLPTDISNVLKMYPLEKPIIDVETVVVEDNIDTELKELAIIEQTEKLTVDKIVELIEEIKGKTKGWMVKPGYFSIQDGMALLPIGTMSSDLARLESVTKLNTINNLQKEAAPWDSLVRFTVVIMGVIVIAWMVIVNVRPPTGGTP